MNRKIVTSPHVRTPEQRQNAAAFAKAMARDAFDRWYTNDARQAEIRRASTPKQSHRKA